MPIYFTLYGHNVYLRDKSDGRKVYVMNINGQTTEFETIYDVYSFMNKMGLNKKKEIQK